MLQPKKKKKKTRQQNGYNNNTCCLQKTHFRPQDTNRLKVKEWKNIFHENGKQKKTGVAIPIWEKYEDYLKIKKITRDKEVPNIGAPQYIRQTLTDIKGETDSNIIIVGDSNTPLTPTDRSSKQKINRETQVLNDTLDEMDLIDIFRTFHPKCRRIYLLLKCTWNILQDRPHLGSQIKPQWI